MVIHSKRLRGVLRSQRAEQCAGRIGNRPLSVAVGETVVPADLGDKEAIGLHYQHL